MEFKPLVGKTKSLNTKAINTFDSASLFSNKWCICCKKNNHTLNDCKFFAMRSVSDRSEFIKKSGLCFGCLKTDHRSKGCTNRLTCPVCNRKHSTCLHDDKKMKTEATKEKKSSLESMPNSTLMQSVDKLTMTDMQSNDANSAVYCSKSVKTSFPTGASISKKIACPIIPIEMKVKGYGKHILHMQPWIRFRRIAFWMKNC